MTPAEVRPGLLDRDERHRLVELHLARAVGDLELRRVAMPDQEDLHAVDDQRVIHPQVIAVQPAAVLRVVADRRGEPGRLPALRPRGDVPGGELVQRDAERLQVTGRDQPAGMEHVQRHRRVGEGVALDEQPVRPCTRTGRRARPRPAGRAAPRGTAGCRSRAGSPSPPTPSRRRSAPGIAAGAAGRRPCPGAGRPAWRSRKPAACGQPGQVARRSGRRLPQRTSPAGTARGSTQPASEVNSSR